jgi:hypothetical protein
LSSQGELVFRLGEIAARGSEQSPQTVVL